MTTCGFKLNKNIEAYSRLKVSRFYLSPNRKNAVEENGEQTIFCGSSIFVNIFVLGTLFWYIQSSQ